MRQTAVAFALAVVVMSLTTATASAKPDVKLNLSGVLVTRAADGHEATEPVEKVTPRKGEIFRYTIVATNVGKDPALKLKPIGKIPSGTEFVGGSASKATGVAVEYSLDGVTWSARPMVTIQTSKGLVRRAADPSAYAAVRWIAPKVAPKVALTFTYEVRVK